MCHKEGEKHEEAGFKWIKEIGTRKRDRDVHFYESFTYDGEDYSLYDSVYLNVECEGTPYVGKLVRIWEEVDKSRKIKVQWFFRPSEISYYLSNIEVLENELIFASGHGIGLANINPLEAIAGKCNVVCISSDNRNRQPLREEVKMADYVFYRVLMSKVAHYRIKCLVLLVGFREKSKWFKPKELSWEESVKTASDEGTLVLLQNFDPDITSGEVEDIIWHAFNEYCRGRMLQHTAISNPHYGEAIVVFRTSKIAESVVKKLDEGCLMLPNQRPLIGCTLVLPIFPGKQMTFVGHLSIDKIRHQLKRERKEAVSTSHYSQTNTIEYEMAMEWCLLQSKSDVWCQNLFELQMEKLKKLTVDLKSKCTSTAI